MPVTRHPYTAHLLQYVHDPASQERLSIGVALESVEHAFIDAKFIKSVSRITTAFPDVDASQLRRTMKALAKAIQSAPPGQLLAFLNREVPQCFDAGVVLSEPIVGITADPAESLARLLARFEVTKEKKTRAADDVWRDFQLKLEGIDVPWKPAVEAQGRLPHKFKHVWQNGMLNAIEPMSLDLTEHIRQSAAHKVGEYLTLAKANPGLKISLLVGTPPAGDERRAEADIGIEILADDLRGLVEVVAEDHSDLLAKRVRDGAHH